jgi:hypothetical protein
MAPRFAFFVFACAAYLSVHAVFRWLGPVIFEGHGIEGWIAPGPVEYAHLLLSAVLPFFALAVLLYLAIGRWIRGATGFVVTAVVLLFLTLLLEVDMTWFRMSARHIGLTETRIFLFEDWKETVGLQKSDLVWFLKITAFHSVAYAGLLYASLQTWLRPKFLQVSPRTIGIICYCAIPLFVLDIATGAAAAAGIEDEQRRAFEARHPLRPDALRIAAGRLVGVEDHLDSINQRFARVEPAAEGGPNPLLAGTTYSGPPQPDILLLVIEGLNYQMARQLPVFARLRETSVVSDRHFSTGNVTNHGIVGLTHGAPTGFYGDPRRPQSAYVDALNRAGYRTRRFGIDIESFGQMDQYSTNYTDPTFVPGSGDELLGEMRSFLAGADAPQMAMVYYYWTHFPYFHDEKFARHQPEVPSDFNYGRRDLVDFQQEIRNRYQNCLDELDDWLGRMLAAIDLDNTIVVITADHGEEMFEHGRVSHAGGLWDLQIRTPLNLLVPGNVPRQVPDVTSHAHIFPAIAGLIGLDVERDPRPYDWPVAVSAQGNWIHRPREWVLMTQDAKFYFDSVEPGRLEIVAVTDLQDQSLLPLRPGDEPAVDRGLAILKAMRDAL